MVWVWWFFFWMEGMMLMLEWLVIKVNVCIMVLIECLKFGEVIKLIMLVELRL